MKARRTSRVALSLALAGLLAPSTPAATMFSTADSYLGSGTFYGPGAYMEEEPLFPVVIRDMIWVTERDFVTPFVNNGAAPPNTSGEEQFYRDRPSGADPEQRRVDGRLSNGLRINENADISMSRIAGVQVLFAAVDGADYNGAQAAVAGDDGQVVMTMDFALDLGIGPKGVVRMPFYGTTGTLVVPHSLQTQMGGKGVDQAGRLVSGSKLTGRIGDFNADGRIDGTIIAAANLPLDSPIYPGQPYVIVRHFETDIPIDGSRYGDVKALLSGAASERHH